MTATGPRITIYDDGDVCINMAYSYGWVTAGWQKIPERIMAIFHTLVMMPDDTSVYIDGYGAEVYHTAAGKKVVIRDITVEDAEVLSQPPVVSNYSALVKARQVTEGVQHE